MLRDDPEMDVTSNLLTGDSERTFCHNSTTSELQVMDLGTKCGDEEDPVEMTVSTRWRKMNSDSVGAPQTRLVVKVKSKEPDPPSESWVALFKDFTQNTTLHGIRYTTLDTRFIIRKVLWLLILFAALVVFLFYMVERVEEYRKFKKNVSVEENYVDSMVFPAITFCNQNPFRITVAAEEGWYPIAKTLTQEEGPKLDLRECYDDEFSCQSGDCIPLDKWCDSFPDCVDATDEIGCVLCQRMVIQSGHDDFSINNVTGFTFDLLEKTYQTHQHVYIRKDMDYPIYLYLQKDMGQWVFSNKVGMGGTILAWADQNVATPQSVTSHWFTKSGRQGSLIFSCMSIQAYDTTIDMPLASGLSLDNLNLEKLYRSGATPMKDFKQQCSWKGGECPRNAFRERLTDLGVCYTFHTGDMNVERSGPGFGLSLTLNIEQFEYTKDPQTGVGIRVLLHDPEDEPLMQGRAFAISPGLNTMVAVEKTIVNNLEKPWGNCSSKPLTYFDTYSVYTCQMECENHFAREECQCLYINMPRKGNNDYPVCTVNQYVGCLHPKLVEVRKKVDFCTCPTPCKETVYVSSLSFAGISTDDDIIKMRQREEKFSLMQKQLAEAREISYRVLDDKYRSTLRMFHMVEQRVSTMMWMLKETETQLRDQLSSVTNIGQLVREDCLWFSRHLYNLSNQLKEELLHEINSFTNYFLHQVVTSFTQFRDIIKTMERGYSKNEQSFLSTRSGKIRFSEYDTDIRLTNPEFIAPSARLETLRSMAVKAEASLFAQVDENTTVSVLDNVTLDIDRGTAFYSDLRVTGKYGRMFGSRAEVWLSDDAFWTHTSQIWIQFTTLRTSYQSALTTIRKVKSELKDKLMKRVEDLKDSNYRLNKDRAQYLLSGSRTTCSWCITSDGDALFDILRNRLSTFINNFLTNTLDDLETSLSYVYNKVLIAWIQKTSMSAILKDALPALLNKTDAVAAALHVEMFKDTSLATNVIDEMLRLLSPKCETEMPKKIVEYQDAYFRITSSIEEMRSRLFKYHQAILSYKSNYIHRNLTLTQVAELAGYASLRTDVTIRTTTTSNALRDASQIVTRITEHINMVYFWFLAQANDSYLVESKYWKYFSMKEAKVSLPTVGKLEAMIPNEEVTMFWTNSRDHLLSMVDNLSHHIKGLTQTLRDAQIYVKSFVDGNSIGEQFFKKNFLQMDLFYKALTDKKVTQQKAYEYPALLSELGGLLGLLLGASSITVIEFLDLIIYNCCVKCKEYRERRKGGNQNSRNHTLRDNGKHSNSDLYGSSCLEDRTVLPPGATSSNHIQFSQFT